MIKLREWTASEIEEYDDARLERAEDGKIACTRVYIKPEVDELISTIMAEKDKAIADLKESHRQKVNQLLVQIEDLERRVYRANRDARRTRY